MRNLKSKVKIEEDSWLAKAGIRMLLEGHKLEPTFAHVSNTLALHLFPASIVCFSDSSFRFQGCPCDSHPGRALI